VESFSQTKFSLDPFKLFKKDSSEDGCSKKDYDECEATIYNLLNNNNCGTERFEQECSNLFKKCECWANTKREDDSVEAFEHRDNVKLFKHAKEFFLNGIEERQKQEEQKRKQKLEQEEQLRKQEEQKRAQEESERLAFAMRDSSANEIHALIKEGTEANLILGKCDEHRNTFRHHIPECKSIQDSISRQQDITEITALLKANEFEKSIDKCREVGFSFNELYASYSFNKNEFSRRFTNSADPEQDRADSLKKQLYQQKINDLCGKQLVGKIKKLPLKKINSKNLAEAYFYPYNSSFLFNEVPKNSNILIQGQILQNDGRTALMSYSNNNFIVKHSGQCKFTEVAPGVYLFFQGFGKYTGKTTYTTVFGEKRTVPAVQLLWCDNSAE
jgi:hypothetical protein